MSLTVWPLTYPAIICVLATRTTKPKNWVVTLSITFSSGRRNTYLRFFDHPCKAGFEAVSYAPWRYGEANTPPIITGRDPECLAPEVGIEPTTNWLTANCTTAVLLWNKIYLVCCHVMDSNTLLPFAFNCVNLYNVSVRTVSLTQTL